MERDRPDLKMLDLMGVDIVQIQISEDGKTLWVNTSIEGRCVLRICGIAQIVIDDARIWNRETGQKDR